MAELTEKGWITADSYLVFFKRFVEHLPAERPVLVVMDSHSSHVTPEAIKLAQDNGIELMTFPAHTTHIIGISVSRLDFARLVTKACLASFSLSNILSGFRATGLFPVDRTAIDDEKLELSLLSEKDGTDVSPSDENTAPSTSLPQLPTVAARDEKKKRKVQRARVLTECKLSSDVDQNLCPICNVIYSLSADREWVKCHLCPVWGHEQCFAEKYMITHLNTVVCSACRR